MSIGGIIKPLWRKRWLILSVPLLTMAAVFAIRYFQDWQYISTAQIATGITTGHKLVDKDSRLGPEEMQIEFNNLIEVIKSPIILNQVSYRLMQHDIPTSSYSFRMPSESEFESELGINLLAYEEIFRNILDKKLERMAELDPEVEDELLLQKVIHLYRYNADALLDKLVITRLNNSDYLEFRTTSEDPELSAFIVNTFCSELARYYKTLQSTQSSISLESLAQTVFQRKENLDARLSELQEFRSNNEIVNSDVESISNINQISNYEGQIASEQQRQRALELTLASLNVRIQDSEAGANGINDEVVAIRRKITAFNEEYVTGGQTNQKLLDSITTLRTKLDETLKRIEQAPKYTPAEIRDLKNRRDQVQLDLRVSTGNLAALNKKLNSLRFNMGDFASREAKRKLLEEEIELAREEYLAAQQRYAQAMEKANANKLNIEQVMFGEPAGKPQTREAMTLVAGSGAVSFLLVVLFVLAKEYGDPRIRTAQRLRRLVKVPFVGVVPELPRSVKNPSWSFFLDAQSPDLERLNDDLRKIRYAIDQSGSQVFLLTSARKGQGKTFLIMALAYTLSLAKKRTLIIDTNLRHNSLTRSLTARTNLKQSIDIFNNSVRQLPSGSVETKETTTASRGLISKTHNEFVDVIGSKISHLSPSEVIPGEDFKKLLSYLCNKYDYIFLEGANLNDFSDSRELVPFVDQVITVFSADSVISEEDKEALQFLRNLNGKLNISILNRAAYVDTGVAAAF